MSDRQPSVGAALFWLIFGILFLISLIPKPVWIALGICAGIAVVVWIVYAIVQGIEKDRIEAGKRAQAEKAARAAAAQREREERARKEKQHRIDTLGKSNASLVEEALAAAQQVAASEAARAGWLGDVDFSPDIKAITDGFAKAHALGAVTGKLAALDKPSADDRRILAEARTTVANLECAAIERVELIASCAIEARHIDASLRAERHDAKVAEQRAELHAKLSAMLYGIEAAPQTTPTSSAVDAVMARVQAYREIKQQIDWARSGGS
ncbi:hypothetical protein [Mycolicibacterium diernhoferi]|uniref:Uncharacterized protein n=1 Tax=Mycolicibacterium diernhoferi TaxID=1801 RepID=A0A1Q4H7M4_9MYCO|nr:hypothetical protein [Mycolicibacterium diernhoferi]OJZ63513.1 hypothetical protein BRW64_22040 [Mycolicibacterium diernhoferi]PEG51756.1 hypothetical protein CRI78_24805 [Mycolicibacterium diernhoferi]QYL24445.1 hypothetical protein K0O62_09415 [Mycolicibacterium diernhoferi]